MQFVLQYTVQMHGCLLGRVVLFLPSSQFVRHFMFLLNEQWTCSTRKTNVREH